MSSPLSGGKGERKWEEEENGNRYCEGKRRRIGRRACGKKG